MNNILRYTNQISHIALDIETAPIQPLDQYDPTTQSYINGKIAKARATDPSMTYEKFASLNANFGKVICLSFGFVAEFPNGEPAAFLRSYTGTELEIFGAVNGHFACYKNKFVHFNGRAFDIPFLVTRMRLLRIPRPNANFENLDGGQGNPHFDLLEYHSHGHADKRVPLHILAILAGLPSPKMDLDGSKIWEAYQDGEIRRIARYCEWDVATTLNLSRILVGGIDPISSEHLYSVDCEGRLGYLAGARPDGSCPSADEGSLRRYVATNPIFPIRAAS